LELNNKPDYSFVRPLNIPESIETVEEADAQAGRKLYSLAEEIAAGEKVTPSYEQSAETAYALQIIPPTISDN